MFLNLVVATVVETVSAKDFAETVSWNVSTTQTFPPFLFSRQKINWKVKECPQISTFFSQIYNLCTLETLSATIGMIKFRFFRTFRTEYRNFELPKRGFNPIEFDHEIFWIWYFCCKTGKTQAISQKTRFFCKCWILLR